MQEFLLTHPSLFIITFTALIIMLIYLFRDKFKSNYVQVEETSIESSCSIEMQTITTLPEIRYDEPDLITPLPNPKIYKKIRNDLRNPSVKYDVPRIHSIPENLEPSASNLQTKMTESHLENLEKKYNIMQPAITPTSPNFSEEETERPQYNDQTPSNLHDIGNQSISPVIHRSKISKNVDNRISVSEVYKHGSYVSFDGEFDQFDDLSRRSNIMRVALNFDPDEAPINV